MSEETDKWIHILGGGTINYVRPHLALSAPAYGTTAIRLQYLCDELMPEMHTWMHLTKMADPGISEIETNEDVEKLIDTMIADPTTKIIFMNVALCDFEGEIIRSSSNDDDAVGGTRRDNEPTGKYGTRLKTRDAYGDPLCYDMQLTPAPKLLGKIRRTRKDIFLVAFKTTCGATEEEQYAAGLNLLKETSSNLVLANDTKTRVNMIITPEEAKYSVTTDRLKALRDLVEMTKARASNKFTRSTVVPGDFISWEDPQIPESLRKVAFHCIENGAYKPFRNSTVGHFAFKVNETTFLTSTRKTNYNKKEGLIVVEAKDGEIIAHGRKPSAGGQTQRVLFKEHPDCDCIIHFHCPTKPGSPVTRVEQKFYECGSHQCAENTSKGLTKFGNLYAVYAEEHGPNIIFHHSVDPNEVIRFIEQNFDLSGKTGGIIVQESK